MQFYSLFIATMALAVSSVYALPQTTDDSTCLRLCRDEPVGCLPGWKSEKISVSAISLEIVSFVLSTLAVWSNKQLP